MLPALAVPFLLGASTNIGTWATIAALLGGAGLLLTGDTPIVPQSEAAYRLGGAIYGTSRRRAMPPPDSSLPNIPPEFPEDEGIETFPIEEYQPPFILGHPSKLEDLPDIEGFQPADYPDLVEIFPDQSAELPSLTILESRGGEWTQFGLNWLRGFIEKIAAEVNPTAEHFGGAYSNEGEYKKETYLKNKDTGRLGSAIVDLTFEDKATKRRLYINTVDTKAKGTQESKREHGAGIRIVVNARSGDIVVLIHKTDQGEMWDEEKLRAFLTEFIREIGRPVPGTDPRDVTPPEQHIRRFLREPPAP